MFEATRIHCVSKKMISLLKQQLLPVMYWIVVSVPVRQCIHEPCMLYRFRWQNSLIMHILWRREFILF